MPDALTKRPSPISIRLSPAERSELELRSGGGNLSAYIKEQLFSEAAQSRPSGLAVADRTLLAHLLATLGGSNVAPNLDRLAREAQNGFIDDLETIDQIWQACDDVRLMHNALMRGLGLKEAAPSRHQQDLADAFNWAAKPGDLN